jgi:hypothetical protein
MFDLQPPRHISTLRNLAVAVRPEEQVRDRVGWERPSDRIA